MLLGSSREIHGTGCDAETNAKEHVRPQGRGRVTSELREGLTLMGQVALRRRVIFQGWYSKEEGIEMNTQSRRQPAGVFVELATRRSALFALAVLLLSLPLPAQQQDAAAKQQAIQEKVAALKQS
jgi:hypothetical protein